MVGKVFALISFMKGFQMLRRIDYFKYQIYHIEECKWLKGILIT